MLNGIGSLLVLGMQAVLVGGNDLERSRRRVTARLAQRLTPSKQSTEGPCTYPGG